DLIILDLVQGKLKNQDAKGPFWIIPRYPTPEQIAAGARPRLKINRAASPGQKALVPLRFVRGVKPPGKQDCVAMSQYRVQSDQACTLLGGVLSCGIGKVPAVGSECTPSESRGTSVLSLDESGLGSLEESLPDAEPQLAFIGSGHLDLMSNAPTEINTLFSSKEALFGDQFIASVPVKFNRYIPHQRFPLLVEKIEVQAGKIRAEIPIEPPAEPSCELVVSSKRIRSTDALEVTLQASSVVSSASVNGRFFSVNPEQSSNAGLRAIASQTFSAIDTKQLKRVVQPLTSDVAVGIFSVRGHVYGLRTDKTVDCGEVEVEVEFYNPRPPECTLSLSPDTQEPDEPVQVTVTAKNTVTSAVLNDAIGISFSPIPGPATIGTYSTVLRKSGDAEETYKVVLTGPGGSATCTRQLYPKTPLPPSCLLSANPSQIQSGQSTTLTLTTTNRVDTASIAGRVIGLSASRDGSGTMTYQKNTPNSELLEAVVSSRWGRSTCSTTLACAPSPGPRCSLTVSPVKVKPGESATVTLSCQDPVGSASIMGTPVALSGGSASIPFTKNGLGAENLEAIARGEGQCGTESRPSTMFYAIQPCRFANPDYKENLKVDVWKFNSYYDVFQNTSYNETIQKQVQGPNCLVKRKNGTCKTRETITQNEIQTTYCPCGQQVGTVAGKTACVAGARSLTGPILWHDADDYVNANAGTCMVVSRSQMLMSNEVKFKKGAQWEVMFQHKVNRVHDKIDKVNNSRTLSTFEVASNLDWFDEGGKTPTQRSIRYLSEAACATSCPVLEIDSVDKYSSGDLCLSKEVEGVMRTTGVGRNRRTYLDEDAVCEAEAVIGKTMSHSGGVTTKAVPGKYEESVKELSTGRTFGVEKICKDNHLCVVERTPRASWNVSDTLLWVEVGPADDESCQVTMIDTAVSVRDKGCFAPATKVQMANGSQKEVQHIRENDYVFNPHYGTGVRVRKVVKGPEKKPLYAVILGSKQIEVTEDHPFFTQRGWVQTLDLKPGDQLFGKGQGQAITKVTRLPYKQPVDVWNFELDTEDPLAHVVVANGIPTGDLVTQLEIKKNKKPLP
ncbi:hypothetical protein EBR78_08075, partial [bacterium]|nr:hypothetical protein [bacterium]